MGHPKICEDERRYRNLEPELRKAVNGYAIGLRGSDIQVTLAHGKLLADSVGEFVHLPLGWDRSSWNDVLNKLVRNRVGTHRCLSCQKGFTIPGKGFRDHPCPFCHDETVEELMCTAGVL